MIGLRKAQIEKILFTSFTSCPEILEISSGTTTERPRPRSTSRCPRRIYESAACQNGTAISSTSIRRCCMTWSLPRTTWTASRCSIWAARRSLRRSVTWMGTSCSNSWDARRSSVRRRRTSSSLRTPGVQANSDLPSCLRRRSSSLIHVNIFSGRVLLFSDGIFCDVSFCSGTGIYHFVPGPESIIHVQHHFSFRVYHFFGWIRLRCFTSFRKRNLSCMS